MRFSKKSRHASKKRRKERKLKQTKKRSHKRVSKKRHSKRTKKHLRGGTIDPALIPYKLSLKDTLIQPDELEVNKKYIIKLGSPDEADDTEAFYRRTNNKLYTYLEEKTVEIDPDFDHDEYDLEGEMDFYYFKNVETGEVIALTDTMNMGKDNTYIIYFMDGEPIDPVKEGYYMNELEEMDEKIGCEVFDPIPRQDLHNVSMVSRLPKKGNQHTLPTDIEKLTQTFLLPNKTVLH